MRVKEGLLFRSPLRALCTAAVAACVCLTGVVSQARAQQNGTVSPPEEKVQQLIELLDDPDIRTWLASRPSPAADLPSAPAASRMAAWDGLVRDHLEALRDALPRIPSEALEAVRTVKSEISNRGFATILVIFAVLLGLGFGAEWMFRRAIGEAQQPGAAQPVGGMGKAERGGAARFLWELAPLAVFSLVSAGVFLAFEWPALLRLVIMVCLVAFIAARLVMAIGRILLAPDAGAVPAGSATLRLLPASDAEAHFWYRRLAIFIGYLMAGWATVSLLPALGFSTDPTRLIAYLLGLGLLAIAIEAVWRHPGRALRTQRMVTGEWLLTLYLVFLWGLWVAGLDGILWLGIYALLLPKALAIAGRAAQSLATRRDDATLANPVRTVMISRGARGLVILFAVLWLSFVWRVDPTAVAESNTAVSRVGRGLLQGVVTLLVADLIWQLAKAYIDRTLKQVAADQKVGPAEAARRSRLRTLLPIFRNTLAVLIGVVAVLMVLAELGVQIAPLIAGAGIFGVAIGFGSQTLVKDVISGVFYMLDDAFRVGEYIQSGSYKGTVESFSLRSVRLRHHRGPVFTVPFGELGAVQNMSRDWVIDKFLIRVAFDTDVQKVKKLVKAIGAELLADPEMAPDIIETVKMKGVEQFGDFGMELSFSVMTKPGQQSHIRRRTYTMIQKAFAENGIEFAQPVVQVGSDEKHASAAAAAATVNAALARKQTAPVAEDRI